METNCNHFNQNFVDKIVGLPNIKKHIQSQIDNCPKCSTKSVSKGFVNQYLELEINALEVKCMLMKSLCDDFKKCVLMEMNVVGSLKKAFDSMNALHYQFFKRVAFSSYENFLKTL